METRTLAESRVTDGWLYKYRVFITVYLNNVPAVDFGIAGIHRGSITEGFTGMQDLSRG
jgi:hypothetical protein